MSHSSGSPLLLGDVQVVEAVLDVFDQLCGARFKKEKLTKAVGVPSNILFPELDFTETATGNLQLLEHLVDAELTEVVSTIQTEGRAVCVCKVRGEMLLPKQTPHGQQASCRASSRAPGSFIKLRDSVTQALRNTQGVSNLQQGGFDYARKVLFQFVRQKFWRTKRLDKRLFISD